MAREAGGVGVLVLLTFGGGVVQNRESPDFRSPEVGRYGILLGLTLTETHTQIKLCNLHHSVEDS